MKKLRNPYNPTPRQKMLRNKAWAKALQENPLKATGFLRCNNGGRCCLGVAEDVAIELGLDIEKSHLGIMSVPEKVVNFFGWEGQNPLLVAAAFSNGTPMSFPAIHLNDGKELPHTEIAECVLNTFVRKKPIFKK